MSFVAALYNFPHAIFTTNRPPTQNNNTNQEQTVNFSRIIESVGSSPLDCEL
jgi:hypothetical protein